MVLALQGTQVSDPVQVLGNMHSPQALHSYVSPLYFISSLFTLHWVSKGTFIIEELLERKSIGSGLENRN
jgi:hypothetical protein